MKKILIVEDEEPIRELIKLHLVMADYDTIDVDNGTDALFHINNTNIDLVLLDIMIPRLTGYQLLPHIQSKDIPVIILTAKNSLRDKVTGLNLGADDYITKPFEGIELLARINSLLRRTNKKSIDCKIFDNIKICIEERKVFKDNTEVDLTLKEFELLNYLVDNKNIAISREKILQVIWEYDYEGNTRTVDMHIQRLRTKLDTSRITTVYKVGYRLED